MTMPDTPPGRYHLTLSVDGEQVLHGWWDNPDTAERKFAGLKAQHEEYPGRRLLLTEWDSGQEWPLLEWPTPAATAGAG